MTLDRSDRGGLGMDVPLIIAGSLAILTAAARPIPREDGHGQLDRRSHP
jgi:hypothetical protein